MRGIDGWAGQAERVDAGLTLLLAIQGLTLFVVIPLVAVSPNGRLLLDVCHLAFAGVCIAVLTRHRALQVALAGFVLLLVAGPALGGVLRADLHLSDAMQHEVIALIAFAFNGAVTAIVARHVFAGGRVTVHRVRGAILLYLNVAALFAIAYGAIAMHSGHAFVGGPPPGSHDATAAFSYFSLTTITTTGFGDVTPVAPLARSLATLEAVFGQLFPATLLARLVALHLAHDGG